MLIAISGSQGCGKTTIINQLKDLGHNVIERKTSRSILTDWNVTLDDVNNSDELTFQFQDEIIIRKYKDELIAKESNELWFTERTYADLFSYALVSLGKNNNNSEWLDDYYKKCAAYQQTYDKVFYVEAGAFKVEHDGVRGSNQHYSKMVDLLMWEYTNKMVADSSSLYLYRVISSNLEQRVEFILDRSYNHTS